MPVKYGEFNYPTLKPARTKKGSDDDGWKRGALGIDGAFDKDGKDFIGDKNPAASDLMYGKRGDRPNGQQVVMTKSRDPGTITNDDDKGYRGVDE